MMYNHPPLDLTLATLKRRLEKQKLAYGELELQNGVKLLVLERGGRVLGPFLTPADNSLLWLSAAFGDDDDLAQFLAANAWNTGGERIWVAPEIQYSVKDRADFWGTIGIPPQMDPGDWRLDEQHGGWRLRLGLTLTANNLARGEKELWLERFIHPVADPLTYTRHYHTLLEGVTYAGYEQIVTLREAKHDQIMSQSWNVTPVWPGGRILIPSTPSVEVTDYFEPIDVEPADDAHLARQDHYLSLRITGDRRYKVGIKAAQTFGRLGYFHRQNGGDACLIVRNYFNNPSSPYVEEPPQTPGGAGDSIHVYNDGGLFGGFGELECHGQTIGGHTGRSSSTDQQLLWVYGGPEARVRAICRSLLGVDG
jgi:hypothetical protein